MKKVLTLLAALLLYVSCAVAQSGIFESYAILSINGGANSFYDMQATTANPDFQGANLGSFNSTGSIVVKGGQNKTFKCAPCDIINSKFYYRVWLTSAGPSGAFTNINEPFLSNLGTGCGGNDQIWEGSSGAANILTGLAPGNYTLEVYSSADYQGCGTGTNFSNNGGANYRATFNFCGPASGPLPAGNYAIPGCFATVAAAVSYINTNGVTGTGNVQFDVAAGYTETVPAGGIAITATGTATLGIKFVKSGVGANPAFTASAALTAGALNDAIFKLIGSDYITIDGFTLQENAANTTTAAATNNMTEWGVALLYTSTTDGAQNNTIQNNTISLNRNYLNSFGVYSNTRHAATTPTTTAEATTAAGSNSNNKVYANNISNVNMGIVFVGSGTAAAIDDGNDIGGASLATGNTITNWGNGSVASAYVSVTSSVYCIFMNQQNNDRVSFNSITSASTSIATAQFGGILKSYTVLAPSTATTSNYNSNTITLTNTGATTSQMTGISTQGMTTLASATININNNNFLNNSATGASMTTGSFVGILGTSAPGTLNINGNLFRNTTVGATGAGSFVAIQQQTNAVVTALNINNNKLGDATGGAVNFSAAAATTATFTGISVVSGGAAATCAITINGNDIRGITYTSSGTGAHIYIINAAASLSQSISNNTFTNLNVNTTGNVTFISNTVTAPAAGSKVVNNNSIVTAFNKGGAGGTVALYSDGGSSVCTTPVQNLNNNFSNITVTGATAITGWFNNDGTGATPAKTITGNVFNNWVCGTASVIVLQSNFGNTTTFTGNTVTNITGQGGITGMQIGTSGTYATPLNFSGNTVTGLSSTGTGGAVTGISNGAGAPSTGINSVSNNTINTLSSSSTTATVAGIASTGSGLNISNNAINTLSCAGTTSGVTNGIMVTAGTNVSVFKNKIYDLQTSGGFTTTPGVNGIVVSGSTASSTYNIYNNLVGDLKAPTASSTDAIRGISVTATGTTTNCNIFYNSIYLNAVSTGANFGTSGVFHTTNATATTATLNLRNNIIVNNSTPAGTGLTVAYRRSSTTLTNYGATSNNNLFYAGTPGAARLIFYDGTNSDQTLTAYKTRVNPRDAVSVSENPPFLSTSGASANFLHINTAVATQVESGASAISGITDDYDGDTRNVTTPDIGADEGNFLLADISGPSITYTPAGNTSCTADITIAGVIITDASSVNTAAGTRPRLYFKKSTNANTYVDNTSTTDGWKYVEASGTGGSPFSFTTNYSLLFGGAPVTGDSISYFIVAQDLAGTPNTGINSGTFTAAPASVALTAAAFPLTGTVNGYKIIAAGLSGTVTIGATGTYTSLSGAAGLFNAINTQGMSGSITANILDASVTETGAVALNAINYNGCAAGPYPLLIKPGSGVTTVLTGSVATGSVIKLNGADFVTFDGSNNGSSSRDMTIQNTTTTTTGNAVIWLASPAAGNGSLNDTVKNCIIEGNAATTTFTGVHIGGSTAIGLTTGGNERNSNNAITNNLFRKTQYGLIMFGYTAATPDLNNLVSNNSFGTAVAGEGFSLLAINADRQQNLVVSGNEVQNVTNATNVSSTPFGGIRLLDFKDGLCYKNNVHDLAYTNASTSKIYGIAVTNATYTTAGNPSNSKVYNNMVSRITSTGTSSVWNTTGILASAGYGDKFYYNTVNLNGQLANSASGLVAAFANGDGNITSVGTNIDVRDNIFSLTGSSATAGGNFWAYHTAATTLTGSILNYNNLYCNGTGATNNIGRFNSTSYTTLSAWQTATAQEANAVSIAPVFVSNSDAHLVPGSNTTLDNLGTPIAGITDDIDGNTRNLTTPDMGADEFSAPTCVTAAGGTASGSTSSCVSFTGNITASGYSVGIGTAYQWLSAANAAGPWTPVSGATNPATYNIATAITATTYYKLAVTCATNSSFDSSTVVTITIKPKPTVPVSPAGPVSICAPATQTLSASGTNAATPAYQWINGTTAIAGETNATYTASASGSYRVRVQDGVSGCFDTSAAVSVTVNPQPSAPVMNPASVSVCSGDIQRLIAKSNTPLTVISGTGAGVTTASTTTSALGPNPLQSYYGGVKQQMLYTAAELSALGITASTPINAIALNLVNVETPYDLLNLVVKMKNTTTSTFTGTWETGLTTVRAAATYTPVVGINTLTFGTPFNWNGADNLVIEINYSNNNAGGAGTNTAKYSPTAFSSTMFYRVDNSTAATVDGYTGTPSFSYNARNDVSFSIVLPSPISWTPNTGLYTDAAATTPYTGGARDTVYALIGGTQTYTATASTGAGCQNTTQVTVTVTGATGTTTLAGTATPGGSALCNAYRVNAGPTDYMKNCKLIATVTPAGANPVSGIINSCVTVDTGATKLGTPNLYVARNMDITPAVNPATSTAIIKLYFLQSEFDNYNLKAADSGYALLPTGPADLARIDSLVLRQFHGTQTSRNPLLYTGTTQDFNTTSPGFSVVWNATNNWWEITVPVTSFSGFYVTTQPRVAVPVIIEYFRGARQGTGNLLDWKVACYNTPTATMVLERSSDGRSFGSIYSTTETAQRCLQPFSYVDAAPLKGINYYRLKMTDADGKVSYSSIVALTSAAKGFELINITPNPVTEGVCRLNITSAEKLKMTLFITDVTGRMIEQKAVQIIPGFNSIDMNVSRLAGGTYQVFGITDEGRTKLLQFVKQ